MTIKEIKLAKRLENGIEFSCQMCGGCCRGFEEGEVYLYMEDIVKLAKHIGLEGKKGLRKFAGKYVKIIPDSFFWREPGEAKGRTYKYKTLGFQFTGTDDHCHFLDVNACSVHEARPYQCRCFPWWVMMVTNKGKLNLEDYAKKCEGLRLMKGTFYSPEEILKWATEEYEIEKIYIFEMKKHNFDISKMYPFLPKEMIEKEK